MAPGWVALICFLVWATGVTVGFAVVDGNADDHSWIVAWPLVLALVVVCLPLAAPMFLGAHIGDRRKAKAEAAEAKRKADEELLRGEGLMTEEPV